MSHGQSNAMTTCQMVKTHRIFFSSGKTLPLAFRTTQLRQLQRAIERHECALLEALRADLGKPQMEAYASEIGLVLAEINRAVRNLSAWARPVSRRVAPLAWPGKAYILPEPYGVALIIGPWNYPVQLLLAPLVGAIAAGNCVCLKPSELAPHTSRVLAELIASTFDPAYISIHAGGRETAEALLAERFDCIFFTGSSAVGRNVMAAAARHLTPVTLELGGKSPCLVLADARLDVAARRILRGKCLNAGQTCVAPDYVLVHAKVKDRLIEAFRQAHHEFFGDSPRHSPHLGRIINRSHFERLTAYLRDGRIVLGGEHDAAELFIAPTILLDPPLDAPVMQEEIFGPLLPVIGFHDLNEALGIINARPKPLALYLFCENRHTQQLVVAGTSSGGVCINDTVHHIVMPQLPFGGVGESGMGTYHGKASFDCFSHAKSVLKRVTWCDPAFLYPPTSFSIPYLKRLLGTLLGR